MAAELDLLATCKGRSVLQDHGCHYPRATLPPTHTQKHTAAQSRHPVIKARVNPCSTAALLTHVALRLILLVQFRGCAHSFTLETPTRAVPCFTAPIFISALLESLLHSTLYTL